MFTQFTDERGTMGELDRILSEPMEDVRERERLAFDRLLADFDERVVLFGAGNLGRRALKCLRTIGVEPLAFTENGQSKWGTQVEGVPVLSPKQASELYGNSALFIVTIWSLGHFYPETREKLEHLGCKRVTSASLLRWKFADQMLPDFCQDLPHKLYEQKADVRRASALWSDELSLQEYLNQVRWRALGDQDALGKPVVEE